MYMYCDTQLATCIPSGTIVVITSLCLYALFLLTLLMVHQQSHSGDKIDQQVTPSANPLQWYCVNKPTLVYCISRSTPVVLYQQVHSGGTLSANPLRWHKVSRSTPVYLISKPTPVVLYLQTHSGAWYSICKPTPVVL